MPHIRVKSGFNEGSVFALAHKSMIIGRDASSDILLDIESPASRRHASLQPLDGSWLIEDLDSVNGTRLNGTRVKQTTLRHGDEISIGNSVFVFEEGDAGPGVTSPAGRIRPGDGVLSGDTDAAAITEL